MKKRILLLSISLLVFRGISYTQDITNQDRKQLSLIMEGNTGTVVNNTDGYFAGNELTIALGYEHGFERVPWLSIFTRLGFISTFNFNNINLNTTGPDAKPGNEGVVNPSYQLNGFQSATIGIDYFETGLSFDRYGFISFRARTGGSTATSATAGMLMKMYGYYPLMIGETQMVKFMMGIEINPIPTGTDINAGDPALEKPGVQTGSVVELFTFGMMYQTEFSNSWSFSSGLYFRTSGHRYKLSNSASGNIWDADTLEAIRNNIYLRWENTITYTYNDSFSIWGQVRYQPERIAITEQSDSIYELTTQHEVFLRFGMNYYFNF